MSGAGQSRGASEFVQAMRPVARELLGEPAEVNKGKRELRWGTRGSMCVDLAKGTWRDHEAGEGGGVLDLVQRQRSLDKPGAVAWLQERGHLAPTGRAKPLISRQVASYRYINRDGEVLFEVVRFDPKGFRPRRPDGKGGWAWNLTGVQRVLYRLPDVLDAVAAGKPVHIAEGEKAADALAKLGVVATCSPGGANKWRPEYGPDLAGADVVILPDNDEPGRQHAEAVARALHGVAARVRVLDLPDLPEKGDAADWIAAGGTAALLAELRDRSGAWTANDDGADLDGFEATEDGIALAFAARMGNKLRFCHHTGAWYLWTGAMWRREETKLAFTWARDTCRKMAKALAPDERGRLGKASTSAAVERFAQADRAFAVTSEIWDRDRFMLGTPGGVVDLRTAELRPARQADYITKVTAVAPSAALDCPLWLDFLEQTTAGDAGLIRFLRQWCGYCLTGDTREHALLFGFGPGGNGKSVFLNTVAKIMGGYALTAGMEVFVAATHDRHSTELARLRGARLVTASETEEGRSWAEARMKQMTGADPITARFMRCDEFTYLPQFKLTIVGNNKPALKAVDDAMRRRFNIVPFLHKPAAPDKLLEEKLQPEWPAILRWMLEGCLDWQRHGLVRPKVVVDATAEYFEAQDHFPRWLAECCDLLPTASTRPSHLLHSFTQWCQVNGEAVSDNRKLRGMIERTPGLRYAINKGVPWVRGIVLKPSYTPQGGEGVRGGEG